MRVVTSEIQETLNLFISQKAMSMTKESVLLSSSGNWGL